MAIVDHFLNSKFTSSETRPGNRDQVVREFARDGFEVTENVRAGVTLAKGYEEVLVTDS